jgi:hypothetical protein
VPANALLTDGTVFHSHGMQNTGKIHLLSHAIRHLSLFGLPIPNAVFASHLLALTIHRRRFLDLESCRWAFIRGRMQRFA